LGEHRGEGLCLCTVDEDDGAPIIHPGCPLTGHSDIVTQVEFSDDGAQLISASADMSVRVWDIASGRQMRQFEGHTFAMVGGRCDERKRGWHILTLDGDTLLIYECGKEQ